MGTAKHHFWSILSTFLKYEKEKKNGKKEITFNVECSTNAGSQIRPDGGGEGMSRIKEKREFSWHIQLHGFLSTECCKRKLSVSVSLGCLEDAKNCINYQVIQT